MLFFFFFFVDVQMSSYIDEFPFTDYIILRDTAQVQKQKQIQTNHVILLHTLFFLVANCAKRCAASMVRARSSIKLLKNENQNFDEQTPNRFHFFETTRSRQAVMNSQNVNMCFNAGGQFALSSSTARSQNRK